MVGGAGVVVVVTQVTVGVTGVVHGNVVVDVSFDRCRCRHDFCFVDIEEPVDEACAALNPQLEWVEPRLLFGDRYLATRSHDVVTLRQCPIIVVECGTKCSSEFLSDIVASAAIDRTARSATRSEDKRCARCAGCAVELNRNRCGTFVTLRPEVDRRRRVELRRVGVRVGCYLKVSCRRQIGRGRVDVCKRSSLGCVADGERRAVRLVDLKRRHRRQPAIYVEAEIADDDVAWQLTGVVGFESVRYRGPSCFDSASAETGYDPFSSTIDVETPDVFAVAGCGRRVEDHVLLPCDLGRPAKYGIGKAGVTHD